MIAGTIARPGRAVRPGVRFGPIDYALVPFERARAGQLKRDLAVVVSAKALITVTDL